jgi:hypothetical protein
MVYDVISMFGINLFYIEVTTLEMLIRRVFQAISFKQIDGKVRLLSLASVKAAFTTDEFTKVTARIEDEI